MANKLRALHPAVPPPLGPGYQPAGGALRSFMNRRPRLGDWVAVLAPLPRRGRCHCVLAGILFGTMGGRTWQLRLWLDAHLAFESREPALRV